jgi:hypothetical protein
VDVLLAGKLVVEAQLTIGQGRGTSVEHQVVTCLADMRPLELVDLLAVTAVSRPRWSAQLER